MMHAMVVRELIVIARRPAVPVAALGIGLLLGLFLVVWAPGVAIPADWNLYQQTRALHWALLAVALPWVAARSALVERRHGLVLTAALIARPPGDLISARTMALAAALTMVTCTGIPALIVAQQAAAAPAAGILRDLLPSLGGCVLIAAMTTAVTVALTDRTVGWLTVTAITLGWWLSLARWVTSSDAIALCSAIAAMAITRATAARANTSLLYCEDDDV